MIKFARPVVIRRLLTMFLLANVGVCFQAVPAFAVKDGIDLELNRANTVAESCEVSFVVRNELAHTLDRFQLELYVFDSDGIIKARSNIDLAPLRKNKSTVLAFRLYAAPCATVSKVLVNDIPQCRADTGAAFELPVQTYGFESKQNRTGEMRAPISLEIGALLSLRVLMGTLYLAA